MNLAEQTLRHFRRLHGEEEGQGTFEYLLILGAAAILIVSLLIAGFIVIVPEVLKETCPTVDPLAVEQGLAEDACVETSWIGGELWSPEG